MIWIGLASDHPLMRLPDEPQLAADASSQTRFYVANEQTFLAWLRTGLSLLEVDIVRGVVSAALILGVPLVLMLELR
jgi:uncharacterized membrane protein YidH (DUF202 family)